MDRDTAARLAAINRAFYREHAEEFSAARQQPWPGWARLPELLRWHGELDVLDVGCGNGRLGAFLRAEGCALRRYVGVDASAELLAHARARALPGASFARLDLVAADPERALPPGSFGLVALFGVLHHVPGSRRRRALLEALVSRVGCPGLLALAAWQCAADDPLRGRFVSWEDWNRRAAEPVDLAQLEPGDCLLRWGDAGAAVRYCHFAPDAELDALVASLPCRVVASWCADGRDGCQNRYFALAPV